MAESFRKNIYPQLLYAKGKAPSQQKSMSYYSYLSNFQMVKRGVAIDAWDALKNSSVGVILRFYELNFIWNAKLVHYLLTHQLQVRKKYEIWSLIDCQPIRLSLIEFGLITGLSCEPFKDGDVCDIDHTEFWSEMNVCTSVGPNLKELQLVLERCMDWSFEKRRMVGWLCILHIEIYGIPPTSRIPLDVAKRVLDPEAFERYPWGRVACKSLIHSVKSVSYDANKSYTMEGFVYVLQVWSYELITGLCEKYGNRIDGEEIPFLSWRGSRKIFEFEDFIMQEKKAHDDKVRVKNFFSHLDSSILPKWDKELVDEELDNLIHDITHGTVHPEVWCEPAAPVSKRRKRKEAVNLTDSENSTENTKNDKDSSTGDANQMGNNAVLTMLKCLTEKVDGIETNLTTNLLSGLDAAIGIKVNDLLNPLTTKIATFEKEIEKLQKIDLAEVPREATDCNSTSEQSTSKVMSWMVQMKSTSQDDLPIPCVVKNVKKTVNKKVHDKKAVKTEIQVPHLLDTASGETFSDPICRHIFGGSTTKLKKPSAATPPTPPPQKRQAKLAPSQLFPFVGNSTVKRIVTGLTPSVTAYDPFADVDPSKFESLLHFQLDTEEKPDRTNITSVKFYNVMTTPREAWPNDTYGWLNSSHMWSAMQMFYQRSQRDPSPYHSQRIVFLDQWFITKLVRDYCDFTAKKWTVTDEYKGVFSGTYPSYAATNKMWLHDVDHLYACHFINGNHWVALDIDLANSVIRVYDSILSVVEDDKEIRNECRPIAKMIPVILDALVPTCVRKKSEKQFPVRRMKQIPQNDNPGDCGVYTIKYIECLAIGCTFEGLNDRNIPQLRRKLAAEIYEEVGLLHMTYN